MLTRPCHSPLLSSKTVVYRCIHNYFFLIILLLIILIIISIFKEDNVFSITASLPYGPPVNTGIDYYRAFSDLFYFCKCCEVSCAICVWRREASACLIMQSQPLTFLQNFF